MSDLPEELNFSKLPDPGDRYKLGERQGSGVFAEVYEATDRQAGGRRVAVKIQNVNAETEEDLRSEYKALRNYSNHANLPDFYGVFLKKAPRGEDDKLWFVMELCEGGPVTDLVRGLQEKNRRMTEEHIAYVLKETVKALVHLHENHVMHRDVRGSNILLTKEGEVKLVDFGLSRHLKSTMDKRNTCLGSPCWMAPEVVANNAYDNRADVWALGITAIELGDGKPPFQDIHPTRALFQIVRNPPPSLYRPSNWSQNFNDFITECLEKNPEHRPFVVELIEHPFLTSLPENDFHLSAELKLLVKDMAKIGKASRRSEVTVRKGLLKSEKSTVPETMHSEDLAAMDNISEDAILLELHERMKKGHCHTFIGDVLLILNPNEEQPIYTESHHIKYKFKARSDNEPHVFAVADRAYQDVMHHEEPQRILLAGETLSGKTTNFMHLLDHLIFLGESGNNAGSSIRKAVSLMHAMGNAATPYNPNSTRHVLNLEVTFTPTGKVSGAIFWLYQLEKWRVTTLRRGHANFHIFYYFYDAMEADGRLKNFHLEEGRRYRYLRTEPVEGSSESSYGVREDPSGNVTKFRELETALKDLSFQDQHIESLWSVLAAVLILGEIRFRAGGDGKAEVVNAEIAETVAKLLQVDEKKFLWALVNYCVIEQGTAERRRHSREEAEEARDVLARGLYHRVVDWFVNAINHKMAFSRAVFGDKYSISIMDLFGFECYKKNSIEQLFVNTLNEQLQYHFNQRMFVWEMQEQEEEEIPLQTLQFYDNKPTVDELMAKPSGMLYVLDEASKGSNTAEFIIGACKGPRVKASSNSEFSVAHYTGKVSYDARDMPDKNRDFLPPEMTECMRLSGDSMVKQLFTNRFSRTGNLTLSAFDCGVDVTSKKGKWGAALVADNDSRVRKFNDEAQGQFSQTRQMRTAAAIYRSTCLEILRELAVGPGSGSTHFVRCVRADLTGQPRGFQPDVVRQQMRALAVVDTARARLKGYPHRIPFPEFIRRYKFLAFDFDENVEVTKDNSRLLLVRLKMEGWVIGKTKVFLKYYNEEYLGRTYELQVKKIVKVQTMMRAFLAKRNVASKLRNFKRKDSVQQIKKKKESIKKKPLKKEDLSEDQAATLIQKQYRGYKVRKDLGPISKGVAKMDENTLSFIREYCKKWKARSMFQVLLMYRAQKHQELVYFCQQVHLYNQLVVGDLNKCNMDVPLKSIEQGARASLVLGKHKPTVWKLPFRLDTDLPFIDTDLLNDPRFGLNPFASEYETEDWDAPLQRRPWLGRKICTKDIGVQTGTLKMEDKKNRNSDYTYIQAPFCRDPNSVSPGKLPQHPIVNDKQPAGRQTPQSNRPMQNLAPQGYKKPPSYNQPDDTRGDGYYNVSKEWENNNILGEDNFQRRNVSCGTSSNSNNNMYGKGPHDRENNPLPSYNRNQPQSFRPTNDYNRPEPVNRRPNPIAEMQMRSQRVGGTDDCDDPPFNFQAMLRKTPTNRASLRRSTEMPSSNYDSQFNRRSSPIEEYNYRSNNNVVYSSNQRSITTSPIQRSPSPRSPTPSYGRPDSKGSYYGSEYQEEEETTTAELAPGIVVQGQIADL